MTFVTKPLLSSTNSDTSVTAFWQCFANTGLMKLNTLRMKRRGAMTTICIPAKDEGATIAQVVDACMGMMRSHPGLIKEILVVDDRSTDDTARIARERGARVVATVGSPWLPFGSNGKGDAIAVGVRNCTTELVTFVDADVTTLDDEFVVTLTRPLRRSRAIHLVKGTFRRVGGSSESGRVTMLTALPLLRLLHPEVATFQEPLGGIFSARVNTLAALDLEADYGVDVGILLDIVARYGRSSVEEVDVGSLEHRRRDLASLSNTAEHVARAILTRSSDQLGFSRDMHDKLHLVDERTIPSLSA